MLILAIDTSGKNGSLALVRFDVGTGGDCSNFETLDLVQLASGTYSAQLVPQLSAMLARRKIDKGTVDAYAVASGPGSFTGLRVGLSTVKALADATAKPIAAVTAFDAVAWQVEAQGRILILLDAGRKQVFVSEFLVEGRLRTPLSEHLLDPPQLTEKLAADPLPIFTPDANVAELLGVVPAAPSRYQSTVTVVPTPQADHYARIGAERIVAGNTVSPAELDANYIRPSDAEVVFRGSR
ncbi:MAG: tRNA (adenosine(37)-N6)-threonylcarbamoyltransferase complex dimerization subunit type 1 TsaB [Terriglobales bacterium]